MNRYRLGYEIVRTENEAREFCMRADSRVSRYARKRYPAHYTPWSDGAGFSGFICWYVY